MDKFVEEAMADLHDEDIKKIGEIYGEMMRKFGQRPNNQYWLNEMVSWAEDAYYKAGFKVAFDLQNCFFGEPPIMSVLGKVTPDYDFDHDQKRWEVLKANERGEKYLGEKG